MLYQMSYSRKKSPEGGQIYKLSELFNEGGRKKIIALLTGKSREWPSNRATGLLLTKKAAHRRFPL